LPPVEQLVPALAMGIALAACAGLRAWLPLLLAGLLGRAGWLHLGASFQFLCSNRALVIFAVATAVELVGDKFPVVDHALDAISTVLRPAAGALLASSVIGVVTDPLTAAVLGVAVGAPTALVPHAAKTGLRAASTALTAGLANPVLSLAEDVAVVVLFVMGVVVPVLVAALVVVAAFLVLRRLARRPTPVAAR
jgi:hypothetical protein